MTFTAEELERIKAPKDKTIHIEHFAKLSEIDPILFDKDYYLVAEPGAEKAYELLRQSLLSIFPTRISVLISSILFRNTQK